MWSHWKNVVLPWLVPRIFEGNKHLSSQASSETSCSFNFGTKCVKIRFWGPISFCPFFIFCHDSETIFSSIIIIPAGRSPTTEWYSVLAILFGTCCCSTSLYSSLDTHCSPPILTDRASPYIGKDSHFLLDCQQYANSIMRYRTWLRVGLIDWQWRLIDWQNVIWSMKQLEILKCEFGMIGYCYWGCCTL